MNLDGVTLLKTEQKMNNLNGGLLRMSYQMTAIDIWLQKPQPQNGTLRIDEILGE